VTAVDELREFIAYRELSHEGREEFDRLLTAVRAEAMAIADTARLDTLSPLSDAAVDRALRVYEAEAGSAYMAHSRDYLGPEEEWHALPGGSEERNRRLAALREADQEAERECRDLMRRAIIAAVLPGS
jgi:hypothetical protein